MEKKQGRINKNPYLLEQGTIAELRASKRLTAQYLKYYWKEYSELALQRNEIQEELSESLSQSCISNYQFKQWQRAVKYKYGLHPLSTKGSLSFICGRFNIGSGINSEILFFSGCYLAIDKDTALQEHLGQQSRSSKSKLTPRDLALTNPSSETIVSVSGQLDKLVDLTNLNSLKPFVELIKNFTFSTQLKSLARKLNMPEPATIKTPRQLLNSLLERNWRDLPTVCDIPSNSQIFGHLVYSAGIEGILYPSKFTDKSCLVIFPKNFSGTDSFIMLDDETPDKKVLKRIDSTNWKECELDFKDLLKQSLKIRF